MTLLRRSPARFKRAALPQDEPTSRLRQPFVAPTIAKRRRNRQCSGKDVAGLPMSRKSIEQIIGERIRARRAELGLRQEQLAAALGLSYQQIQKYENGSNRITVSRLLALAERLEVPVTYFFAGLPGATPPAAGEAAPPLPARSPAQIELERGFSSLRDERVKQAMAGLVRTVAEREA
jgi:transcriptional regulator with XRE-family HTH domain